MTRFPNPSAEDIATANAIISRVKVGKKRATTFAKGDFPTGAHLTKKYFGHTPSTCCNADRIWLHDRLREMVGMTYARNPLPEDRVEARKAICHGCPVYHPNTYSCGILIVDAMFKRTVDVNGVDVQPCGCAITLKALFKSEECPGDFWTK